MESYTWEELLRMHVRDVTEDAQRAHSDGLNALQAITTTKADTTRASDKMDVCKYLSSSSAVSGQSEGTAKPTDRRRDQ